MDNWPSHDDDQCHPAHCGPQHHTTDTGTYITRVPDSRGFAVVAGCPQPWHIITAHKRPRSSPLPPTKRRRAPLRRLCSMCSAIVVDVLREHADDVSASPGGRLLAVASPVARAVQVVQLQVPAGHRGVRKRPPTAAAERAAVEGSPSSGHCSRRRRGSWRGSSAAHACNPSSQRWNRPIISVSRHREAHAAVSRDTRVTARNDPTSRIRCAGEHDARGGHAQRPRAGQPSTHDHRRPGWREKPTAPSDVHPSDPQLVDQHFSCGDTRQKWGVRLSDLGRNSTAFFAIRGEVSLQTSSPQWEFTDRSRSHQCVRARSHTQHVCSHVRRAKQNRKARV